MTESRTRAGWRLLIVSPRTGAENMARDEGLIDRARETGETVFSVYGWERPTLSLGVNQTARDHYDLDAIAAHGLDVVRRPTGGRALLHNREVTYSVAALVDDSESLSAAYRRINRILLTGLGLLGVDAVESAAAARTPFPGTLPCFATPASGELVSRGAKLVGSAQVRKRGAMLQHGSILIDDDQPLIELLLAGPKQGPAPPAATLSRILGRAPSAEEVAAALFEAVRNLEDGGAAPIEERETAGYTASHIGRYSNEMWTWRR
ncbi:MAG: lipoate--protein ligase family protein [Gemmatimonadaceae bacterium]